jgi:hypothetical protein
LSAKVNAARKNSIATILGNGRYMLTDIRGVSHLLPDFTKGFDLDRNVGNFPSDAWPRMKVFGLGEPLSDQCGSHIDSMLCDNAALSLMRKQQLRGQSRIY